MGIRAHRIIEIKLAECASFKLWENIKFMHFLDEDGEFFSKLNSEGTGEVEVTIKTLKKAIKRSKQLDLDEQTIAQLQQDIDFARLKGNKSVIYDCF